MREFDVGSVLVFDEGELVGIVTEHDLLRAAAEGVNPADVIVRDYMTTDPVPVLVDDEVADAAAVMLSLHSRHLPVIEGDRVVGLVSARDLLAIVGAEGHGGRYTARRPSGRVGGGRPRFGSNGRATAW